MLRRKEDLGVRLIEIFLAKYYICEQKHIQLQHREPLKTLQNVSVPILTNLNQPEVCAHTIRQQQGGRK